MNRRGFLAAMLAAAAAPAIVKAGSLMRINPAIVAAEPTIRELIKGEIGYLEGFRFVESSYNPYAGMYQDWEGRKPVTAVGQKVARWDHNGLAEMVVKNPSEFKVVTNETMVGKYIVCRQQVDWKDILING